MESLDSEKAEVLKRMTEVMRDVLAVNGEIVVLVQKGPELGILTTTGDEAVVGFIVESAHDVLKELRSTNNGKSNRH